ncbi:unnamed protein product [Lactuca saligna]|uniref:Uncharacterized protein n=1 Tax=Lactuca saligna TaxID=75948 RepID=A0AA35VVE8_LACSI|nr:unnamed protein product [Lactuca saligna]
MEIPYLDECDQNEKDHSISLGGAVKDMESSSLHLLVLCGAKRIPVTIGFHHGMKLVKLMEERNMKPLDLNLAALSARCSKDLELNLAKSLLSEMGQCTTAYPYNQLFGALVLKNYERKDATT